MITRQEIMDFSRTSGLDPNVIEKDYVLGWLLDGISSQETIRTDWVFKGGTCLKKCYFETHRFSEDLDFTLKDQKCIDHDLLIRIFREITDAIYEKIGIEMPKNLIGFEIYQNPGGKPAVEGKISYRGPMKRGGPLPRIKLDLTADELIVMNTVVRKVHHPYSDAAQKGFDVQCYCFEEVFAEKIRALAQRLRPRDLYDVVHLYRHDAIRPDRLILLETLRRKCDFKGISLPTMKSLRSRPEWADLEKEWESMLAHQLAVLPPYEQFQQTLPEIFEWLYQAAK